MQMNRDDLELILFLIWTAVLWSAGGSTPFYNDEAHQ